MYRILLVDDEGLELGSLKMITEKEFGSEAEIRTASSGRMAIEVFDSFRPDIVVMDIQMPGINGLDAIKEIKKEHTGGKFLMLTAYDSFDYVQQALNIGVSAYLTKPFNRQGLIDELRGLMNEIDKDRLQRREDLLLREKLDAAVPMLEIGLTYSILLNQNSERIVDNYLKLLGITHEYGYFVILDFNIEEDPESNERLASFSSKIMMSVKELFKESVIQQVGKQLLVMVFCNSPSDAYAERLKIINRADELRKKIEDYSQIELNVGIGGIEPLRQLSDSHRQASLALRENDDNISHYDDLPLSKHWEEGYPQEIEYDLYEAADAGNPDKIISLAEDFFNWMKESHAGDITDVKLKVLELVMRIEYIIFHTGGRTYHFMERHGYLETVNGIQDIDKLGIWYMDKIRAAINNISEVKEETNISVVEIAKKYIENNYFENINLNDVAEMVHVSPYYFSKLFKEKTGRNFIDYLTSTRMENAKKMLKSTNQSVKEICLSVGYMDPNYFSRSFKKYEGVTPGEYREACNI